MYLYIKGPDNPGLEVALKLCLHGMWIIVQTLPFISHECPAAGLRWMCARDLALE